METTVLKEELKANIIKFLNLISVTPADIKDDEPLFGEGLGLDSIDAIELIVFSSFSPIIVVFPSKNFMIGDFINVA